MQLIIQAALDPGIASRARRGGICQRSYWIPGSWNLGMVYTDDILFPDPRQESNGAGQYQESHR